ncbi:MAG: hypothetical protein DMD79_03895 [Candidatus Rokuibacteriota bacterium]|jgi:hypothetical protein|nr:MAG: hypothetical protein DMD79_03895 [Candidatus Rokubacteria bacterium]
MPRAYETLLATIRARCPDAETAMAARVTATLQILLPRFRGITVTEAGVEDLLDTVLEGLVAWQLAHSEPWGEAEDTRRLSIEVLARAVVGQARGEVRHLLLGIPRH